MSIFSNPFGGGDGTGDVAGPASSVDENIAVFDGVTGKRVKDGGVKVSGLEPVIATKNTAFNKDFGTTAGTVMEGDATAGAVTYSNTTSGLTATNVQAAIDEVHATPDAHNDTTGKQGGDTGEYYHLDAADYANRQVPFVLNPDATGLDADLTTYNAELTGFLYFATDTKKAYWKTSDLDGNHWSVGAQLGWQPFLHIQDQKAQGTQGGTFTSGAWRTRDLNTVLTNTISGASLATNQITLPAGKYYVEASAPAHWVVYHQTKIRRITATAADLLIGTTEFSRAFTDPAVANQTRSFTLGIFELDAEIAFELQHRCHNTRADNGLGVAANFTTEVYSDIRIWRIGEYVAP